MKKLKAALIAAVAVLMSIGLIACGGKKDPENPTPDDSLSIRSMDLSNTSFTLTDADKDDAAWKEKVLNNLRVLVIYSDNSRNNLDSSGYTVDKSSVQLGVIGVYSAKVTPTANNAAGFSATIEISVEHNIVNGVCTEDGATLTTETIDADLEYKRFHTGDYVLDTHGSSAIRPFGTVTVEGRAETVQTTTVGRLEKGMTITVKGTARTTYPDYGLEDEHWFFPVIGFADTASGEWEYNGGTGVSVMVRNEGWVLLDGVGTSPRLLAAQAGNGVGGAIAETNYGSHPSDTGTKPNNYQAHGTGEPSLDQWIEWYTYSTGTTSDSNTYLTEQNIELSWTYRNDDIIELTYLNTTVASNPVKLVARTKVPASKNGYYDTILHGEYVTMHFTEISTLQTETLASVQYNGLKSGAKTVYLENEMLDLSSLNVQITTVQNSTPQDDASFDVEAKIGNNWVSLSATPLSADMTEFRVTRTKGVVTKEAEIPANFITIQKNGVNEAYAHTVVIDGVAFANNALLGKLDFSSVAEGDGAYALLTLAGAANTLTDAQKAKLTGVTAQKYVAFRIWARDGANTKFAAGAKPTVKSGAADVAGAYVNVTADYADVVLPVNPTIAETGVVISGLTQDAVDVHLNLSGVECLTVASLVSHDTLYLDRGGDVTVVYDFGAEGYASIKANIDRTMLYANTASIRFNVMNKSQDGTTYTTGETKLDGMDVRVVLDEAAGRITVTYSVPKFNVKAVDKYDFSLYTFANNRYARQAIDTVYYEMQFAGNEVGQAAGSDVYVEAEGTKLYIAIAVRANDVLSANVKRETLNLNINDGTLEGLNFTNLGYRYVKGS
ncbi:MAG: hypothetical protein K2H43_06075, partial [Clostridia bacterium]|nr:hypothetical protein [Clostridia bacterium]